MKAIFSDKWAPLGLVIALGLFAGLVIMASHRLGSQYPELPVCLSQPKTFHDRTVLFTELKVLGPDRLIKEGLELPVRNLPEVPVGQTVHVLGRFDRAGYLEVTDTISTTHYKLRRRLMIGLSILVLAVLGVAVTRRFRSNLSEGFFEGRSDA